MASERHGLQIRASKGKNNKVYKNRHINELYININRVKKSKREINLDRISEFKARFEKEDSTILKERLYSGVIYKEAAIAIKQVLQERNEL